MSYSELENHTAAIAAPIFANDGTVVAIVFHLRLFHLQTVLN
ncbi:hypothetical protein ACT453_04505, partial [Bacillus sp. D-CC]